MRILLSVLLLGACTHERRTSPPAEHPHPLVVAKPAAGPGATLALTQYSSCFLAKDGAVSCAGGFTDDRKRGPGAVSGLTGVSALAGGGGTVCARSSDAVRCFTLNGTDGDYKPALLEGTPAGARDLAVGAGMGCVRTEDGHVACWGNEAIGDGTLDTPHPVPTLLALTGVSEVAVTSTHSCVRLGGEVRCWGQQFAFGPEDRCSETVCRGCGPLPPGAVGQNYDPSAEQPAIRLTGPPMMLRMCSRPTPIPELGPVAQVALSSGYWSCARLVDGTVSCWGAGLADLELGAASSAEAVHPRPVKGLDHVTQLVLGDRHGCAVIEGGTVRCFGRHNVGQLGDGPPGAGHADARPIAELTGVVELAAGGSHTCARKQDGSVLCWGDNDYGQLGDGTTGARGTPAAVHF